MHILAIDTSCDDTSIAAVAAKIPNFKSQIPNFKILSNIVSSQVKLHRKYGGVYPTLAKREHQKNLVPVLKETLKEAKLLIKSKCQNLNVKFHQPKFCGAKIAAGKNPKSKCQILNKVLEREPVLLGKLERFLSQYQKPRLRPSGYGGQAKIDAIAVTVGPGLEPCLWIGVNFAKALGYWWNLPVIPINHIEAHILANFLPKVSEISNSQFPRLRPSFAKASEGYGGQAISNEFSIFNFQKFLPAIALVVSGGHTQLILVKKIGEYKIIGETRDDAAGECFDKTARILGLPYPGGPSIAAQSKLKIKNEELKIKLPRPMIGSKDYDFSFSGLKTAVLYEYRKQSKKLRGSKEYIKAMAKEIQQAIIDVLITKTIKAAKQYKVKSIMLGGGVAANNELRKQFNWKLPARHSPKGEGGEIGNWKLNFLVPPKNFCTDNAAMIGATGYFHQKQASYDWKEIKVDANLRVIG